MQRAGILRSGLLLAAAFSMVAGAGGALADEAADRLAVVDALNASAVAWSKGDLDGFMQCYEASPDTAFVGRGKMVNGAAAIKAMYAARFGKGSQTMGHLSFTVLDYKPLGAAYALLTGRFSLQKPSSPTAPQTGIFTLVFHKSAGRWAIISDHTSS